MFGRVSWSHDPLRHANLHRRLDFPAPPHDYVDAYDSRPRRHRHHHRRRRSLFALDVEGSECSSNEAGEDDRYHLDSDSTLDIPPLHRRDAFRPCHEPNISSHCRNVSVRMSSRAPELDRDEVLVLPPTLTRLRVSIRAPSASFPQTLRVAVAGDTRFRDLIRQLIPQAYHRETCAYIKSRGVWVEPGAGLKFSDLAEQGSSVMNERREVKVKIVISGVRDRGQGRGAMAQAWEREMRTGWEWSG